MKSKAILIVDDHPLYSKALASMVHADVGEDTALVVSSAEEGLALASAIQTLSLILLDLNLPGLSGIEAIRTFRQQYPTALIIVISASEDRQEAKFAFHTGAVAFVSKAASSENISDLIRRALANEKINSEWITTAGKQVLQDDGNQALHLTPRQLEILELLMQGHSNKKISNMLGVAEITVKIHLSAIFRILNVVNRTQAVMAALRLGLCTDNT